MLIVTAVVAGIAYADGSQHHRQLRVAANITPPRPAGRAPGTTAAPTVAKVDEDCGPADGGSTVLIYGTNLTGATAVSFGSTAASTFNVVSATEISAISPAETAGTASVVVTTPGGTSGSGSPAEEFTFGGCEYVANFGSGSVSVLNADLGVVTATIHLPSPSTSHHPDAVALSSNQDVVYVADPAAGAVYPYSTRTGHLQESHDLTTGIEDPTAMAVGVDGTTAYLLVANSADGTIEAFKLSSASGLPTSASPAKIVTAPYVSGVHGLAVVPGKPEAVFASTAGNAVGELDLSTWKLSEVADPGGLLTEPDQVGLSTTGGTAYVTLETGPIVAIDVSTLAIAGEISGSFGKTVLTEVPSAVICPADTTCLETNAGNDTLGTISTASSPGSISSSPDTSPDISGPVALALSGQIVLVADDGDARVGLYDTSTGAFTTALPVGTNPCSLAAMGA